jgi:hypothetical protein
MNSVCPFIVELPHVMSNFDREIVAEIATRLQKEEAFARYAGWDFNGRVWWDRETRAWCCEVWTYGVPREVVMAAGLQEIMDRVCGKWGDG